MKKGTKIGNYTYHGYTTGRWQGSESYPQTLPRDGFVKQGLSVTRMVSVMTVPEGYEIDFEVQDSVVLKKKDEK